MATFASKSASYAIDGGDIVLLGAATVEQTGLVAGRTYEFVVVGGLALFRWGADDASIADGGFDFAVPEGAVVRSVCPDGDTAINVIEGDGSSTATAAVFISLVEG